MNQGIIHLLRIGAASFCAHKLLINVFGDPLKKENCYGRPQTCDANLTPPHQRGGAAIRTRLRGSVRLE